MWIVVNQSTLQAEVPLAGRLFAMLADIPTERPSMEVSQNGINTGALTRACVKAVLRYLHA